VLSSVTSVSPQAAAGRAFSIRTPPRPTRALSGIQPTGRFHRGNSCGAIRQYIDLPAASSRRLTLFGMRTIMQPWPERRPALPVSRRQESPVSHPADSQSSDLLTRPFRTAIQIGVVVRDLDRSMEALSKVFGIGPFRVVDCPAEGREDQQFCHGEPCRYRTRQAFADLGTVELELIEPVEGRTIWAEFLATRGPGIHHIRFNVPDEGAVSGYLATHGIGKTQEGAGIRAGSYWANYATEDLVGFIIEILQPAPGSDGLTPGVPRQERR
jgi:hypothetical protein